MSLQPMTAHILFLFLLLGGAECLVSSTLRAGNDSEWQACTEVVNDSLEYCCYHKRCQGNSTHQGLYINCDTSSKQCALNETGYPFCVENEQGGSYGICKKMIGYTCSCDHDALGILTDKPCSCEKDPGPDPTDETDSEDDTKSSFTGSVLFYIVVIAGASFGLSIITLLVKVAKRYSVRTGRVGVRGIGAAAGTDA